MFTSYADRWTDRRAFFSQLAEILSERDGETTNVSEIYPDEAAIVMREDYIAHSTVSRRHS